MAKGPSKRITKILARKHTIKNKMENIIVTI
jgi:hypothetical protein